MYFIIASLVIGISCSLITIKILVGYNKMPLPVKVLVSALVFSAWFAPVVIAWVRRQHLVDGMLFNWLSNFLYYLFGLAFLLFCLIMLRDMIWFVSYSFARIFNIASSVFDPKNPVVLGWANLITVGFALLMSWYAVYEALKMPAVKEITLETDKISRPTRFVLLNDTHITRSSSDHRIEKIIDLINAQQPDAVLMAGDIIDDRMPAVASTVDKLKRLKAPLGVYASLGNHEFYAGIPAWYAKFKELGFNPIANEGIDIPSRNIFIAAVPDLNTSYASKFFAMNFKSALKGSRRSEYKILLSHNPEIDLQGDEFDLQLSGHTHGGQIWPFHYAVKKVNKYLAGLYDAGNRQIYVSRGAGYWGPPLRLFAPSEITVINIVPENSKK